jgi:ISXO2-like transposase domain
VASAALISTVLWIWPPCYDPRPTPTALDQQADSCFDLKADTVRDSMLRSLLIVEGVFSLIKRGVMCTFHGISKKHLPNYLNEFEFRYNTRKMNDGQRVARAIKQVDGKRLEYRESVDNPPYPRPAAPAASTVRGLVR